jgi:hypothetical protein
MAGYKRIAAVEGADIIIRSPRPLRGRDAEEIMEPLTRPDDTREWLQIAVSRSSRTSFGRPVSSSRRPPVPGGDAPDAAGIAEFVPRAGERPPAPYQRTACIHPGSRKRGAGGQALAGRPARHPQGGYRAARSYPFDGSLRRRLRVTDASGHADYFVVWRPGKLAGIVNSLR